MPVLPAHPHSRTLSITSPILPKHAGHPALTPVKLEGHEGINELFRYEVTLKTPDDQNFSYSEGADYELDAWIGREATIGIELEGAGTYAPELPGEAGTAHRGAGERTINGLITQARFLRNEGRHAFYQLTLQPWLYLATLTSDCQIFQDITVVELLGILLADYPYPVEKRLTGTYPKRDYQTQYNETDYTFFQRLCEEWGIHWHFTHSAGQHTLVLTDELAAYRKNPSEAYQTIRFHPLGDKIDEEHLYAFVPARQIVPGRTVTRDYDYTRPKAELEAGHTDTW
jgi:type VI secretion system secreted protein VgrG